MNGGKTVTYEYVTQPHMVPVYGYMQTLYNRDKINWNKWSYVTSNVEQGDRTLGKKWKNCFLEIKKCNGFLNKRNKLSSSIIPSTVSQSSSSSLYAFLMLSHFLWKLCNSVSLPTPSWRLMRHSINSWIISLFSVSAFLYFRQDCLYLREFLVETFQSS